MGPIKCLLESRNELTRSWPVRKRRSISLTKIHAWCLQVFIKIISSWDFKRFWNFINKNNKSNKLLDKVIQKTNLWNGIRQLSASVFGLKLIDCICYSVIKKEINALDGSWLKLVTHAIGSSGEIYPSIEYLGKVFSCKCYQWQAKCYCGSDWRSFLVLLHVNAWKFMFFGLFCFTKKQKFPKIPKLIWSVW